MVSSGFWKKKIYGIKIHIKCFPAAENLIVNASRCTQEKSHLPDFEPVTPLKLMRYKLSNLVTSEYFT